MDMKSFQEKLKLIDENYPWSLPSSVILGGQLISGAFILTEISLMVWFCLKHRKSMTTLFKIISPLAKKIHNDPKVIEQLVQHAGDFVTKITPPTPPPRPSTTSHDDTLPSAERVKNKPATVSHVSLAEPSSTSTSSAHRCTLDFIMEVAQELYAKGHLCIKPYAGYLKEKRKKVYTMESET